MIDDDKFKRVKDTIKAYGLSLNEKQQIGDHASDYNATICPLARVTIHSIKRSLTLFTICFFFENRGS